MRVFDFVPVCDHLYKGESLIETAFGGDFCVVDEIGRLLTTAHNQNLLRRARMLVEANSSIDTAIVADSLAALKISAETLTQSDYERAVQKELRDADREHLGSDTRLAGSLA